MAEIYLSFLCYTSDITTSAPPLSLNKQDYRQTCRTTMDLYTAIINQSQPTICDWFAFMNIHGFLWWKFKISVFTEILNRLVRRCFMCMYSQIYDDLMNEAPGVPSMRCGLTLHFQFALHKRHLLVWTIPGKKKMLFLRHKMKGSWSA